MEDETQLPKPEVPAKPKKVKVESRVKRWGDAATDARDALERLKAVQEEYQEWLDKLPENLQGSALGEKLTAVCELDLDGALETAGEAEGADLPLGFGKD